MRYLVQLRDRIFGFLGFAKNVGKIIGKSINKALMVNTVKSFSKISISN